MSCTKNVGAEPGGQDVNPCDDEEVERSVGIRRFSHVGHCLVCSQVIEKRKDTRHRCNGPFRHCC